MPHQTPKLMSTPKVDHDALIRELEILHNYAETADIKSRSQVRLESAESERERLELERAEVREQIERIERIMQKVEDIHRKLRANEADINIDILSQLATINVLREAGVTE